MNHPAIRTTPLDDAAQAKRQTTVAIARRLIGHGVSRSVICAACDLTVEEYWRLRGQG